MIPRVKSVKYLEGYKLLLTFTNDEKKQFDLISYLKYPVYKELNDEYLFRNVKVKNGILQWNDSIDFDPDTLYLDSVPINF